MWAGVFENSNNSNVLFFLPNPLEFSYIFHMPVDHNLLGVIYGEIQDTFSKP